MGNSLKYLLPFWSAFGVYTVLGLMLFNGTFKELSAVKETGLYPKTNVRARNHFTGIEGIDAILQSLNVTWWPIIDGSFPSASLHTFEFAGQYGVTWTLLLLESLRKGNSWRVISFITLWGLVVQVAAYGTTVPLYLAVHLWTSSTVSGTQPDFITVDPLSAAIIPYSMTLGYVVPVAAVLFPDSVIGPEAKQAWLAIFNVFPVFVTAIQFVLSTLGAAVSSQPSSAVAAKKSTLSSLRLIYSFAFGLASVTHVTSWGISLSSLLFPALYSPDIIADLHPGKVFLPILSQAATEWPLGIHRLLQWDNLVGSSALLGWAATLWGNAYSARGVKSNLSLIRKVVPLVATSGFAGAAVVLLWERDELLFSDDTVAQKKIN